MQAILIVGEDHRFHLHPGVDPIALCRAFWRTVICGRREGGSTIAMQLVRVLSGRFEKTLVRKCLEINFAVRLSRVIPKEELPTLYLSVSYYGWEMNGYLQACDRLNLDPASITLQDAASLVARLKYPEHQRISDIRKNQIKTRSSYLINRYENIIAGHRHLLGRREFKDGSIQSIRSVKGII